MSVCPKIDDVALCVGFSDFHHGVISDRHRDHSVMKPADLGEGCQIKRDDVF